MNKTPALVLYHGNGCQDGFMACYIAYLALGYTRETIAYQAVNYGEAVPDLTGKDVFILDFSYKPELLLEAARTANSVVMLDHHKTAMEDWRAFGHPVQAMDEDEDDGQFRFGSLTQQAGLDTPKLGVHIHMRHSGAGLAWDHFDREILANPAVFPTQLRNTRAMVDAVEDRDLWLFKMKNTRALTASLSAVPRDFEAYTEFFRNVYFEDMVKQGAGIIKHNEALTASIALRATPAFFETHAVPLVNCSKEHASIVGHVLCQDHPFSITYEIIGVDAAVSLRSVKDGFDVSAVAKKYGGGGHRSAAGFKLPVAEFFFLLGR